MVMNLITSNLIWIFAIACGLFWISTSLQFSLRVRGGIRAVGFLILGVGILGAVEAIYGPPGGELTVPEIRDEDPPERPSDTLGDILSFPWNAEKQATWPIALIAAKASALAYLPPTEAEAEFKLLGFEDVGYFEVGSMAGYVATLNDFAVVAFRGSDDIPDFVENLKTTPTLTPHGSVHLGFYASYQRLRTQVRSLLSDSKTKKVWITGHSLGGALGVMCAYDLVQSDWNILGLLTFGQPLVARKDFAEYIDDVLDGKFAHFVNEADIVTRIPPSYTYCGSVVWFVDGGVQRSLQRERLMAAAGDDEVGADPESEDLDPLSQREFQELKQQIRAEETGVPVGPDDMPLAMGASPLFDDHAMALYLEKVAALLTNDSTPEP